MTGFGNGYSIPQPLLVLYATYVVKTSYVNNRQVLTDLRDLLDMIDPEKTYGNLQTLEKNTYLFLKQLVATRLKGIENRDILIQAASKGVDLENMFKLSKLDDHMSSNELRFIEENILEYRNHYYVMDMMSTMYTAYADLAIASEAERHSMVAEVQKKMLDTTRRIKNNISISSVSETFAVSDTEQYDATINHIYERSCSESNKLQTGIVAFNDSLAGGFENDRCYIYLGLPGEGKSSTLLNLALQIKEHNKHVKTKDPTKTPTILFLTMENTLDETIERMFSILVSDENINTFENADHVKQLLREGGLAVTPESPIDIVIKYVPSNTVDTDYLYTLYDELLDDGKEVICLVQDYIKRIKCRDYKILKGDMRLVLGAVVDEFKEFAIAKHIPVITASQLNRDAAKVVDEGRTKGTCDLVNKVSRSNIGESTLIIENADSAFILMPEVGRDGIKYLGVSSAKRRFKNQRVKTFFHPYEIDRPLALIQDVNLASPVSKTTLNELAVAGQQRTVQQEKISKANVVKATDDDIKVAEKYGVDPEFVASINKSYNPEKYDKKEIIIGSFLAFMPDGKILMYRELNEEQQDFVMTKYGFTPDNGTINALRDFESDNLEEGEPVKKEEPKELVKVLMKTPIALFYEDAFGEPMPDPFA